jgi:hypothetical protein
MTWKDVKEQMEKLGVKDDTEIEMIDIDCYSHGSFELTEEDGMIAVRTAF